MGGTMLSEWALFAYQVMSEDRGRFNSWDGCYSVRGIAEIVGEEDAHSVISELAEKGFLDPTLTGGFRFVANPPPVTQLDLFTQVIGGTH
jgi:hypothetical protein